MTDPNLAKQYGNILQGFTDPTRIGIVEVLRTGPKNVTQLATLLGVEIVNVSHHLSVMREAGLVESEKHGRSVVYSLHPSVFTEEGDDTVLDIGWCRVLIPHDPAPANDQAEEPEPEAVPATKKKAGKK